MIAKIPTSGTEVHRSVRVRLPTCTIPIEGSSATTYRTDPPRGVPCDERAAQSGSVAAANSAHEAATGRGGGRPSRGSNTAAPPRDMPRGVEVNERVVPNRRAGGRRERRGPRRDSRVPSPEVPRYSFEKDPTNQDTALTISAPRMAQPTVATWKPGTMAAAIAKAAPFTTR